MRWIATLIAVSLATPVQAAPVYLNCVLQGAEKGFDVTVDEAKGTAAVSELDGDRNVPAVFTINEVTFTYRPVPDLLLTTTIDRRTLAVTSQARLIGMAAEGPKHGTCKLAKAEDNKF